MRKTVKMLLVSAVLSAAMATTAFAAVGWRQGSSGWWYALTDNGDDWCRASTGQVKWYWLDGNGDGTSECYCFNDGGWLFTNCTTPDGYQVNADGKWVVNGVVQTKSAYIRTGSHAMGL